MDFRTHPTVVGNAGHFRESENLAAGRERLPEPSANTIPSSYPVLNKHKRSEEQQKIVDRVRCFYRCMAMLGAFLALTECLGLIKDMIRFLADPNKDQKWLTGRRFAALIAEEFYGLSVAFIIVAVEKLLIFRFAIDIASTAKQYCLGHTKNVMQRLGYKIWTSITLAGAALADMTGVSSVRFRV